MKKKRGEGRGGGERNEAGNGRVVEREIRREEEMNILKKIKRGKTARLEGIAV